MNDAEFDLGAYYPIFAYLALLLVFAVSTLVIAHTIGPRKATKGKQVPYESGMDPIGDARQAFDVRFYLVAILFLVFDVELLFLYPWAVSAYTGLDTTGTGAGIPKELSDAVYVLMLVFMGTLGIAYIYAWRKGVFRWR